MPLGWILQQAPRKWQLEALSAWQAGNRGVVEVVTGAGKTFFALQVMAEVHRVWPTCRFLILVPTTALQDQWHAVLTNSLTLKPEEIGLIGGGNQRETEASVFIAVLDSARRASGELVRVGPWCLIVDECHRAASPANRMALRGEFVATLGLSATPERQYDTWFEDYVVPVLGPVIFEYSYTNAKLDGILSDFDLWNVRVPLTDNERTAISQLNKRIASEMKRLKGLGIEESPRLTRLLLARSRASQTVRSRLATAAALVDKWKRRRGLIFHESIEAAEALVRMLGERGHRARIYHSQLPAQVRFENLRLYTAGQVDILVACRALDEGLDVPDTDFGIIAAATSSRRQRTQRLGRILRPSPNGTAAIVASLFALDAEEVILRHEASSLEGVATVRWFGAVRK